jgi:hypothetical protein
VKQKVLDDPSDDRFKEVCEESMTICVAIKVHDCLVFAADSATSIVGPDDNGQPTIVNVMAHGNKVFNIIKGLPICAMTCGMGNIGRASISTLAKDLRRRLGESISEGGIDPKNYTIAQVAEKARVFLYEEKYLAWDEPPNGHHSLEFYIGGYSASAEQPEVWKIVIANGDCPPPICQLPPEAPATVLWSGQPEALNRLLLGYSQHLPDALIAAGLEPEKLEPAMRQIQMYTRTPLAEDPMPTGDAIALADFLVHTTKMYVHFLRGADTVGGDTDIATVTKYEGFKWIKRKHYYPPNLNKETDHV